MYDTGFEVALDESRARHLGGNMQKPGAVPAARRLDPWLFVQAAVETFEQ